jgi:hypothetical protein
VEAKNNSKVQKDLWLVCARERERERMYALFSVHECLLLALLLLLLLLLYNNLKERDKFSLDALHEQFATKELFFYMLFSLSRFSPLLSLPFTAENGKSL